MTLRLAGLAALLFVCGPAAVAFARRSQSAPRPLAAEQRAREIGAQAYVYGAAPLVEQNVLSRLPVNVLINLTQPIGPTNRLVVLPNVDTLYTTARLELAGGPIVIHVPDEHGRYYALQLLDAYTNVFGYIGRRVTGTRAGNYAIVGPGWHGRLPNAVRRIRSPTDTVWIIGRTLFRGKADTANAVAIQRGYKLSELGGAPLPSVSVPGASLNARPLPGGLSFYDALDAELAQNPPPRAAQPLLRRLASVGIAAGRDLSSERLTPPVRRGLLAGLGEGRRLVQRYGRRLVTRAEREHNGWLVYPKDVGRYGTDYLLRTYVAQTALGVNVPAEATYLTAYVDHSLAPLSGRHRYVLRFAPGQLPPVRAFWSLTMYGSNEFLVPNPIGRYDVGDRTSGLQRNRDGSLQIVIQHAAPRRHRSNWLPAPRGRFMLFLRLYEPTASVLNGRWRPPTIERLR